MNCLKIDLIRYLINFTVKPQATKYKSVKEEDLQVNSIGCKIMVNHLYLSVGRITNSNPVRQPLVY